MSYAVPNPYVVTTHPYPTRYHGGSWIRPVTGPLPYMTAVQSVFKPDDFNDGNPGLSGLGAAMRHQHGPHHRHVPTHGLGIDAANGVFGTARNGGGVFGPSLFGIGADDSGPAFMPMIDDPNAAPTSSAAPLPALKTTGDGRVSELQGYLNYALKAAGLPTITEDGKLGPKSCGAILWYQNTGRASATDTTRAAIDMNLGAMGTMYSSVCNGVAASLPSAPAKASTYTPPATYKAPTTTTPTVSQASMLGGAGTWAMIGGGVLAIGLAVVGKKKGWF